MKWSAPKVVDVWQEQVEAGTVEDELKLIRSLSYVVVVTSIFPTLTERPNTHR